MQTGELYIESGDKEKLLDFIDTNLKGKKFTISKISHEIKDYVDNWYKSDFEFETKCFSGEGVNIVQPSASRGS